MLFLCTRSNKFDSLQKASSTRKTIKTAEAAVDAMFSKTREYHSKTMKQTVTFYLIYTRFLRLKNKKRPVLYDCALHLNSYIIISFSYLEVQEGRWMVCYDAITSVHKQTNGVSG